MESQIAGPGSTEAAVELRDCDPGYACCVVVVCDSDVAGSSTGFVLVDGYGADAARADVAAEGLAGEAVALVEGIDVADGAALEVG